MADKKITELTALTSPNQKDLVYVVDDPTGTPASKKLSLHSLFGAIPANTSITGTLAVSANSIMSGTKTAVNNGIIQLSTKSTVASNNATTVLGSADRQGSIFWDSDYLYVATANNQIKRVALSVFS